MARSCCVISWSTPRKVASTKRRYRSFSPSFILQLAIIILQYAMSRNRFGLLSIDWGLGPSAEQVLAKARELVAAGTNAVQNELERLRKLQEELNTLAAVRQAPKLRRLPPVATLQLAEIGRAHV